MKRKVIVRMLEIVWSFVIAYMYSFSIYHGFLEEPPLDYYAAYYVMTLLLMVVLPGALLIQWHYIRHLQRKIEKMEKNNSGLV